MGDNGLFTPKTTTGITLEGVSEAFCYSVEICDDILCSDCLYSKDNLDELRKVLEEKLLAEIPQQK